MPALESESTQAHECRRLRGYQGDHPEGIRSVVMDGITGPGFDVYNDYNANIWYGLQQLFTDCAGSSILARLFSVIFHHLCQSVQR